MSLQRCRSPSLVGRGGGGKLLASVLVGDTDLLTRRGRRKVEETGANKNKQKTHMLFLFIASVVVLSVWLPAGALLGFFTLAATTVLFLPALGVRRGGVTGTAQLSWKVVPSQIQRCAFALGILALLGAVSVATTQDWLASPRIGVGLRYVAGTGLAAACILASHLRQRRYWLPDKGLFCATASVLGSLGNRSVAARPIAMWADLVSFEVGQCEIVLRLRTAERNRGLLLGSAEAKVPLVGLTSDRLPEMSAELAGQIVARIRQHGAGASESVTAARPAQGKGPKPDGGLSARDASEGAPVPAARTRWQRVRPVVLTWALLSVLTSAPYLAAALDPPPGRTFVGFFFYPGDMLLTASYVKQAEDGAFLFKNKLYLGDQRASYVNLEWWGVGILSRLLGGNPALAYRLFGLVVSFFFVAAVDRWLRRAALPDSHRLPALVLTMTAAGLGGMRFFLLHSPRIACLDFIAGLFPIWELLYDPLLVTGTTLLLWSVEAFTDARDRRGALRAGLSLQCHRPASQSGFLLLFQWRFPPTGAGALCVGLCPCPLARRFGLLAAEPCSSLDCGVAQPGCLDRSRRDGGRRSARQLLDTVLSGCGPGLSRSGRAGVAAMEASGDMGHRCTHVDDRHRVCDLHAQTAGALVRGAGTLGCGSRAPGFLSPGRRPVGPFGPWSV